MPRQTKREKEIIWDVTRAIIAIHHRGEYFEGMDILCQIVGYSSLNHAQTEVDRLKTINKFNDWIKLHSKGF